MVWSDLVYDHFEQLIHFHINLIESRPSSRASAAGRSWATTCCEAPPQSTRGTLTYDVRSQWVLQGWMEGSWTGMGYKNQ